jgi:hypothetical protein
VPERAQRQTRRRGRSDRQIVPLASQMQCDPGQSMPEPIVELQAVIASGRAILFTGAGFSMAATDRTGACLPDGDQMRRELWALLFDTAEEPDDSSLPDLYDAVFRRDPERLSRYLQDHLRVGDGVLPDCHARWFAAPWRKIYTLNVDDLAEIVASQCELPRRLAIRSALAQPEVIDDALEVIHLNGRICDGPARITFSTLQYASRLCGAEHDYQQLVRDLERHPFVFVGTTLDEVVLWQHLQMRTPGGQPPKPHRSFVIARSLSRARRLLLEDLGLAWIPLTMEQLAAQL